MTEWMLVYGARWNGELFVAESEDSSTTTRSSPRHAGLDPASSSGFEDWTLAFASVTDR